MSDLTDLVPVIEGAAWQWWTASPDLVPLEFSYPYLAREGSAGAIPNPISSVALAFGKPSEFVFLTRSDARDVPPDWPQQMAEDRLDFDLFPTALSFELFALNDRDRQSRVLGIPHREQLSIQRQTDPARGDHFHLAFWAGEVGARVAAEAIQLRTHEGVIELGDVRALSDSWWAYWRAYWQRRGTAEALPYDPSCEVTIPFK